MSEVLFLCTSCMADDHNECHGRCDCSHELSPYLEQLKDEVQSELADKKYEGRSHFSRNLYAEGCHGPLCTYRERLKAARLYALANPDRKPRAKKPEAVERDRFLDSVLVDLHGHVPSELGVPA